MFVLGSTGLYVGLFQTAVDYSWKYGFVCRPVSDCGRLFLSALVLLHNWRSPYAWESVNAAWASVRSVLLEYDKSKKT